MVVDVVDVVFTLGEDLTDHGGATLLAHESNLQ